MDKTRVYEEIIKESHCGKCGLTIIDKDRHYEECNECGKPLNYNWIYCDGENKHYCPPCAWKKESSS